MPQVIPLIIYAVGTAFAVNAVVVAIAVTLASLALSSYQKRKADRAANAAFDAAQVDRLVNSPATTAPRELVLGRVRKGGTVFFRSSVGAFKEKFVMCIALASHEIANVDQIYFNDQPVQLDGSGRVTTAPWGRSSLGFPKQQLFGSVTILDSAPVVGTNVVVWVSARGIEDTFLPFTLDGDVLTIEGYNPDPAYQFFCNYSGLVFNTFATVRVHLGGPGQVADTRLQELFPGVWTADHRVDGVAYLVCEFDYDETAFPSGLPNVTALVAGAKIFDPRSGATAFTENPAVMMRHVLLHPQFGKRIGLSASEDARIIAAANACDPGISYFGTDWVSMYRAACVIQFGSPAHDALDDLAQAMGGQWANASGEFFVCAGVYQAPVMALTDDDLAVVQRGNDGSTSQSQITISPHRARNDKINTILPRIWDQAAGYVQTSIMPFRADALVAADGAELVQEVTMPAVFYAGQAFHIAGIMLRDGRDPLTVTLPFKLRAYPAELLDGVTLTLARYGWTAKEFRVLNRTLMPEGYLLLTLKETSAAIYQWGAGFIPAGYADNTGLPRPWDIKPPVIVDIRSGEDELIVQGDGTLVNTVRVIWAPVQDASINQGGTIEARYQKLVDGIWHTVSVPGDGTQAIFSGIEDRALIYVCARTRNSVAVSDWSLPIPHQVIGKTSPPPNIEGLNISGTVLSWRLPTRPRDLAGFVFRFHYGVNLDWNSATPLHDGLVTESPWEPKTRPGGTVTIMGKAIDTTGNMSLVTANIVMDLGDPPIANVVEQWDFNAMGWPYLAADSTGWTMAAGKPSANALDSFYGTDNQSFFGLDTDPFYDIGAYGEMVYVTDDVPVGSALSGSLMTLTTQAQGVDLRIEYRLAGPGSFYGADAASFYGADADPRYGSPGAWQPWPGQLVAANDVYQFRVTIGAGVERGILQQMVLTVDAPDINEVIADLAVSASGTAIPYTKPFTVIKAVNLTLQANGSGAVVALPDKTSPLAPSVKAYNSAGAAVSGATVDVLIQGY